MRAADCCGHLPRICQEGAICSNWTSDGYCIILKLGWSVEPFFLTRSYDIVAYIHLCISTNCLFVNWHYFSVFCFHSSFLYTMDNRILNTLQVTLLMISVSDLKERLMDDMQDLNDDISDINEADSRTTVTPVSKRCRAKVRIDTFGVSVRCQIGMSLHLGSLTHTGGNGR